MVRRQHHTKRAKIKRGISRHKTLQTTLKRLFNKSDKVTTDQKKKVFVKSLHNWLLNNDCFKNNIKVYSEVPIPSLHRNIKDTRPDIIIYIPDERFISIEYKTTESCNINEHVYKKQINRTANNILRVIKYVSNKPMYNNKNKKKDYILFTKLLTVRNYHIEEKYSDYTKEIGTSTLIPNLLYTVLINKLYKKSVI